MLLISTRSLPKLERLSLKPQRKMISLKRLLPSPSSSKRRKPPRNLLEPLPEPSQDGDLVVFLEVEDGAENGTEPQEEEALGDQEEGPLDLVKVHLTNLEEAASLARERMTTT